MLLKPWNPWQRYEYSFRMNSMPWLLSPVDVTKALGATRIRIAMSLRCQNILIIFYLSFLLQWLGHTNLQQYKIKISCHPQNASTTQNLLHPAGPCTWSGRLGMMHVIPKPTRSRLVKMKALVALTIFWICLSGRRGWPGSLMEWWRINTWLYFVHSSSSVYMHASSPLCTLLIHIFTIFELPVHDIANHRRSDQT